MYGPVLSISCVCVTHMGCMGCRAQDDGFRESKAMLDKWQQAITALEAAQGVPS